MSWKAIDIVTGKPLATGKYKAEVNQALLEKVAHGDFANRQHKVYPHPLIFIQDRLTATDAASIRYAQKTKVSE